MLKYILRRLFIAIPTILLTITIIFFGLRVLPGDPALVILGENASPEALEALRVSLGVNLPIWEQYIHFLVDIFQGDFGQSLMTGQSVAHQVLANFPNTLILAFGSIIIGCVIGIPLGIFSARRQNTRLDSFLRLVGMLGISAPPFLLGIFMILLFSLKIKIFPSVGAGEGFVGTLSHLFLPALTLGIVLSAVLMRFMRTSLLEEINKEYIRTARAKGIPENWVVYKHVLRNSLIPVVTVIGLNMTSLISGAVLVETIFTRPGLGNLAVGAIMSRDFPLLQGCLILFTAVVMVVNLLVDISYSIINPRIRA